MGFFRPLALAVIAAALLAPVSCSSKDEAEAAYTITPLPGVASVNWFSGDADGPITQSMGGPIVRYSKSAQAWQPMTGPTAFTVIPIEGYDGKVYAVSADPMDHAVYRASGMTWERVVAPTPDGPPTQPETVIDANGDIYALVGPMFTPWVHRAGTSAWEPFDATAFLPTPVFGSNYDGTTHTTWELHYLDPHGVRHDASGACAASTFSICKQALSAPAFLSNGDPIFGGAGRVYRYRVSASAFEVAVAATPTSIGFVVDNDDVVLFNVRLGNSAFFPTQVQACFPPEYTRCKNSEFELDGPGSLFRTLAGEIYLLSGANGAVYRVHR